MLYKDVNLTASDGIVIRGWFMYQGTVSKPTLVFMHENAGNLGERLGYFKYLIKVLDVNVLGMAYRGYSESDGSPTEAGLKLDSEAILRFLEQPDKDIAPMINQDLIFAHGRSLGGAVAVHMASKAPTLFRGLIVENSFTSISDMANELFPFLYYMTPIKNMILRIGWNSDQVVPELKLPILYITGDQDEIVPHEQTLRLHALSKMAVFKELYTVAGGTHNDSWYVGGEAYGRTLKDFMARCADQYQRPGTDEVDRVESKKSVRDEL